MPNYSLIMNSKFQPFSFERYIQPLQIYGQAYREQEDALAELYTKSNIWDGLANEQTDPVTHAQYKEYADDLKAQATLLATEGLNPSSRQAMLNLKSRYAKEIVPIEQAYQRRAEQIAEQRKAGNTMINSYTAATTSLDKFLQNPALSYASLNRADLFKTSTALMGQFANELREFKLGESEDKFYKKLTETYGLTKEEATIFANAIARGEIDETNAIQALAQHIYNATGVAEWDNVDASNQVWQTIAEGVTAAIGKQSAKLVEDKAAIMAQQQAYAKELQYLKMQADAENKKKNTKNMIDPINLYNKVRDDKRNFYEKKGFVKRGKDDTYILTDTGKAALNTYNRAKTMAKKIGWSDERLHDYLMGTSQEEYGALGIISKTEALEGLRLLQDLQDMQKKSDKDFVIMQPLREDSDLLRSTSKINDEAISELLTVNFGRNIHSQTAYRYQIGKEDSEDVLSTILSDYGQGRKDLDIMEYDPESQKYKVSGTLKKDDLSDYRINNIQVSSAGNIVEFLDEDNNTVIVRLPNSRNSDRINIVLGNISRLQNQMSSLDPSSTYYTALEEVLAEQEAALYQIISDSYRKNKSKNQEFN